MNTNALIAIVGVTLSAGILYQNYIQNATTRRDVEPDLRDKLLNGKGWEGELFSVAITDVRVIEDDSYTYKARRLLTREFRADTLVSVKCNGLIVEEEELSWLEDELESAYDFRVSIYFSELEEVYQIRLGTIDESDIMESIGDFHLTVDELLVEGEWSKQSPQAN